MKKESGIFHIAAALYVVVVIAYVVFFIYMGNCEHVAVKSARDVDSYQCIEDYNVKELEDASAPIGIRREYSWILNGIDKNEASLVFYAVHQYVQVYIDDEMVYSVMPAEGNRIGKTTSSNWVSVPLYESDNGKEIRVLITPVYESVRNRDIQFEFSSYYKVFRTQLQDNLIQLILAGTCLVLGLFIMFVQIVLLCKKKTASWHMFFLGNATMLIGLWKITDSSFAPLIFGQNTKALGFVLIGILFLVTIPFSLFLSGRYRHYRKMSMVVVSFIGSGVSMLALILQITGVADFKQMLPLAHLMILVLALWVIIVILSQKRSGHDRQNAQVKQSIVFSLVLFAGVALDLVIFYVSGSSADVGYTLLAILIYTMGLFTVNIQETSRRAYTDAQTGLFNKFHWENLMDNPKPITEPIGLMMLDLNRLKYVNDTMGHDAGDKMIFSFANILRNSIPPTNTICRWGGDEFAVMFVNVDQEIMEQYAQEIQMAVQNYNDSGEQPSLQYAMGYVLSTEFPELSRKNLFEKADERMYYNKKKWYRDNHIQKR